ncbi:MAG: hypothetical protein K2Y22_15980 [Candidatus Obscuribacterales bacterium]|nr:hypothetical protein [Candidatus Obscuribacterales bacterium]
MSIRRLFVTGLLSTLVLVSPAYCDDTAASSGEAPSSVQLKGQVIQVDVQMTNLNDARLDISRARKAIANLYDEVTRQQVIMNYTPNVVGTMVIMTPTPSFGATLPARTQWVDEAMSDIVPIINLFKQEVDIAIENNRQVEVSDATHQKLEPLRDEAFKSVKTSSDILAKLETLTKARPYDNAAIASTSKSLDGQMKTLDNNLKKAISLLKKEAKTKKS